ncbi:MAG: GGDEF domain-containing protein [Ruminococcaceae bacterium]|nr:GGDEF domain-containing protein [Oscillospiraceae bacterium]
MEKNTRSLSRSITTACALFIGLLCVLLAMALVRLFKTAMYGRYQEQMHSILDYAQSFVDNEDMSQCAETYVETERYRETQNAFDRIVDYYKDLHYLYILKVTEPGDPVKIRSVCSASTAYEKIYEPDEVLHLGDGDNSWYSDEVTQKFREIQSGSAEVYFEEPTEWGVDYTLARPLVDLSGRHYAVLCVDISIDEIHRTIDRNVYIFIGMVAAMWVVFIATHILWMRFAVISPLRRLGDSVSQFVAISHGRNSPDELDYHSPDVRSSREFAVVNDAIENMVTDMKDYVKRMAIAESAVTDLRSQVSKDAATHVGNLVAFERMMEKLNRVMEEQGTAALAIVSVDLNDLSRINTKYGRAMGDEYLVGSCGLVCDVYCHSPVFRVGGNEFAVVLQNRDYENRDALLETLRKAFEEASAQTIDKQPWRCYSAAVGMAVFQPGTDTDANAVYGRAAKAMHAAKTAMKAKQMK